MASDISLAVGDGSRRMTYAELGQIRGISSASAERLVRRHKWPRQLGNDGVVRVLVPLKGAWNRSDRADRDKMSAPPETVRTSRADKKLSGGGRQSLTLQRALDVLSSQLERECVRADTETVRADTERARADRVEQRAEQLQTQLAGAQAAERIARDDVAVLRISERGAVAEVAALHQQLEVTERQVCTLRTELAELRKTEQLALDWAKTSAAEASDLRKKADDAMTAARIARDEAAGLRTELDARREWGLRRRLRWALSRRRRW